MIVKEKTLWQRTPLIVREIVVMAALACVLFCVNYFIKG